MNKPIIIQKEVLYLLYCVRKLTLEETADKCNCSVGVILKNLKRYGIPSRSYKTGPSNGKSSRFKKGQVSWNKGMKGIHFSPQSEFKAGHRPANSLPVGSIKERNHRTDGLRRFIKVEESNKWMELSRYLWLQEFGKIIPGDKIVHLDRDSLNDSRENLLALPGGAYLKFTMYKGTISEKSFINSLRRYGLDDVAIKARMNLSNNQIEIKSECKSQNQKTGHYNSKTKKIEDELLSVKEELSEVCQLITINE